MSNQPAPAAGPAQEESALFHLDALRTGTVLAEFEVTGLLGVGGFGMVYSAYDSSLQRTVAIKEYMPSALAGRSGAQSLAPRSSGDHDALAAGLRSFVAEARLLAQLDHPSLVKVYRFWEANNTAYMVMPLYRGMTLKEARRLMLSPPPEPWLRVVLWSVLGALDYLHGHNMVHRDISPDNIFLQDVGPPVLLDLGAARRAISGKSEKHTAILKVNYAPIEQYAHSGELAQGPWTDLYSLAAVVHGCLCNAPPTPATVRAVRDRMPSFASVAKTVQSFYGQSYSRDFVRAIAHALCVLPDERQQSVAAFIEEMGLAAPEGKQPASWRDWLVLKEEGAATQADPHAMTLLQAAGAADTAEDLEEDPGFGAPATDAAELGRVSAYGVLEQESPLLVAEDVPAFGASPKPLAANLQATVDSAAMKAEAQVETPVKAQVKAVPRPPPPAPRTSNRVWIALAGVAVLAVAGYGFLGGRAVAPQASLGPAVATPAAAVVVEEAAAKSSLAPSPQVGASGSGATPPLAQGGPAPTPVNAASSTLTSPAPSPAGKKPVAAGKGPLAANAGPSGAGVSAAARNEPPDPPPRVEAGHAPAPPKAPLAPLPSAPQVANVRPGPAEVCAGSNFLTRPMCIFNECEKPEFTQLALCVENRRRLKENSRPADRQ